MHPRRAGMVRAAAPVSGGSPTTGGDADERRLARFYAHYGKHHLLPNVPRMVSDARAEGGLEMMFDALCRLHGPEPPPPQALLLLPPALPPTHPEEREAYARRLTALYERHRPARLCDVDTLLDAYAGREDDLIRALVAKYGPEPPEPGPPQRGAPRGGAGPRRAASVSSQSSSESLPPEDVSFLSSQASVRQQLRQRGPRQGQGGRAGCVVGVDGSFAEDPVHALLVENRVLLRKRQFAVLRHVREAAAERLLRRLFYRLLERVWGKRCRTTVEDAAAAGQREIERELATNFELHGQIEDLKRRLRSADGDGGGGTSAAVAAGEERGGGGGDGAQPEPRKADAAAAATAPPAAVVPPPVVAVVPSPALSPAPSPSPSPSQGDAWQRRQQQQLVQRLLVENNLLRELGLSQRANRRHRRRRRRRRSESRRRRGGSDDDDDDAPLAIAAPPGAVRPASGGVLRRNPAAGGRATHSLRAPQQQQRHPPQEPQAAHGRVVGAPPRTRARRVGGTREERELDHLLRFLGEAEVPRDPPAPEPVHVTVRPTLSPPRSRRPAGTAPPALAAAGAAGGVAPFFSDHRRRTPREAAAAPGAAAEAAAAAAAAAAGGEGGGFHPRSLLPSPLQAPSAEYGGGRSVGPFVSLPQPQPQPCERLGAGSGDGGAPAAPEVSSDVPAVPHLASPRIRRQTVSIDFPGGGQQRREVVVGTYPPEQQQQQQQHQLPPPAAAATLSEVAASSTQLPSGDLSAVTSLGGFFDRDALQQHPHSAAPAAGSRGSAPLSVYEQNVARHNVPASRTSGAAPSAAAPQPVDPAAAARDAFALHKATQGLGTDGAAVFAVVERVRSQGEWDEVQRQFGYAFPSTCGGSLVGVLADALNKAGWRRCEELLARRRIVLEGPVRAPPAVQHAAVLHGALAGLGTDGATVCAVVGRVRSQEEWEAVKGQFRRAYPQHCGGDLLEALAEDLNKREMQRCREVLGGKRVSL